MVCKISDVYVLLSKSLTVFIKIFIFKIKKRNIYVKCIELLHLARQTLLSWPGSISQHNTGGHPSNDPTQSCSICASR